MPDHLVVSEDAQDLRGTEDGEVGLKMDRTIWLVDAGGSLGLHRLAAAHQARMLYWRRW